MAKKEIVKKKDNEELKVSDIMFKVTDDFYVGTDGAYNIILYERKVVSKSKETKNAGKEYYNAIGYHSHLASLFRSLTNKISAKHINHLFSDNVGIVLEKITEAEQNLTKYGDLLKKKE